MELRITSQVIASNAIAYAQQATGQLAILQQEASTGLRILQPSDDPLAALQVLSDKAQNNRLSIYHQNISDVQSKLNSSVSTLNQVSNLLAQAKDLALQGSNSTNSTDSFQAMATQVSSILNEVLQLANTQQNGQYLYGGTASQTQPFTLNAQGQVVYNGSAQSMSEPIGEGQQVQTLYAGSQVFQSPDVFQTLASLRDALNNVNNLSPGAQTAAIQQTLQELDNANTGVLNTVGQQSASLQNLQGIDQHIQDVQLQTTQQIGNLQNADLSQVVVGLQEQQNALQASLYSASHIMSLSLLNFLK
ncbi:MAG TPA: flagellar hook-associated protein FlgL [Gemmataceae bacterium]|nr:flagellar hook-associated protein FlgL [Gemmataceae bacterium]